MNKRLTALIHREEDGFVAFCPGLDIVSHGSSIQDARDQLREALELFFDVLHLKRLRAALMMTCLSRTLRCRLAKLRVLSGAAVCSIDADGQQSHRPGCLVGE